MTVSVVRVDGGGYRLDGDGPITEVTNRWLTHLEVRCFSPRTVRGYAFDLLNFSRFLVERNIAPADVVPTDLFDWLAWQSKPAPSKGKRVVRLSAQAGASPATMNRRVAAVRGLFDYVVICGERAVNPVPSPQRSSGLRAPRRGLLGHVGSRRPVAANRLVRQERRLPENLPAEEVADFLADLETHRDRAIVLVMLLGGL